MLRVAYLNIFWSNGSYEVPIKYPDPNTFQTLHPDEDNLYFENENLGFAVLKGDWNYAFYNDCFYFLDKIKALDVEDKTFKYTLTRDLNYELYKLEDLHIYGCLNKVTDEQTAKDNLEYLQPLIDNPIDVELIDLQKDTKDVNIDLKDFKFTEWKETKQNGVTIRSRENRGTISVVIDRRPFINKKDWDLFIEQYKKIPNKSAEKTTPALLAYLKTTKAVHRDYPYSEVTKWRVSIIDKLENFLKEIKEHPENIVLGQIGNINSKLNGKYQLFKKGDPNFVENVIPLETLKQLDFSFFGDKVISKELHAVNLDDLEFKVNNTIEVYAEDDNPGYNPRISMCIGHFDGAIFYQNDEPWTNDKKGAGSDYPCLGGLGINNRMQLVEVDRDYNNFKVIHLGEQTTVDQLKAKKDKLDRLDKLLKQNHTTQSSFFYAITPYYYMQFIAHGTPRFPWIELDSSNKLYIDERDWLSTGLPRQSNGDYDYQEILNWINETEVELFTTYSRYGLIEVDRFYFLCWGKAGKSRRKQKTIAFHTPSERTAVHSAIRDLIGSITKLDPEKYLKEIKRYLIGKTEYIINDRFYYPDKDYFDGITLLNLEGSNYYLVLHKDDKISIVFKDFNQDANLELIETYKHEETKDTHLHELINTKKWISVYGKEYPILDNKKEIKDLVVSRLSADEKLNPYENLVIEYKSDYTGILDVHLLPKEVLAETLSNFNAVEYVNTMINHERAVEDHNWNLQQIRINRNKEDFDLAIAKEKWAEDYNRTIINTVFTSIGVIAGSSIAALFTGGVGLSVIAGAASGIGKTVSDAIYGFNSLERSRRELKENEKKIAESRVIENFKLDANKRRLDEDNKRSIERMSLITTKTTVNDRDLLKKLQKKWNVGNAYLKTLKPSPKQMKEINAHYAQYGMDCAIPKYTLTWKDVKDKSNVWGFKYIEGVNIKDPVIKLFVVGKFINGVKLIKPTFN